MLLIILIINILLIGIGLTILKYLFRVRNLIEFTLKKTDKINIEDIERLISGNHFVITKKLDEILLSYHKIYRQMNTMDSELKGEINKNTIQVYTAICDIEKIVIKKKER